MKKTFVLLLIVCCSVLLMIPGCSKKAQDEPLVNLEPIVPVDTMEAQVPVLDLEPVEEPISEPVIEPQVMEEPETVLGYRVQIHAFQDEYKAESAKVQAKLKLDLPIYTDVIYGWYKVRVGDFATKEEAEFYRQQLVSRGFRDAWVVQCQINRQ